MVLTDKAFLVAGSPRFDEQETAELLSTSRTDSYDLSPRLRDALDKFQGRKGGLLLAADKATGEKLTEFELPSSPVFDGMIAADGQVLMSLMNGTVVCLSGK